MNSCLEKPCHLGFAFFKNIPFQLDHYGSFRYVVAACMNFVYLLYSFLHSSLAQIYIYIL